MSARVEMEQISQAQVLEFARLSGDQNPLHVDPIVARRTSFGRPVVHGVVLVLRALEISLSGQAHRIDRLRVRFLAPICVGDRFTIVQEEAVQEEAVQDRVLKIVAADGLAAARIELQVSPTTTRLCEFQSPLALEPEDPGVDGLLGLAGSLPLRLNETAVRAMFPALELPMSQIAALATSSVLVGMRCPGLHSLYVGLDLEFLEESQSALAWSVEHVDARFGRVRLAVSGAGCVGSLEAAVRPRPVVQLDMRAACGLVRAGEFAGHDVIIVGGTRGLGELAAKLLAAGGARVLVTGASGSEDGNRVVSEIVGADCSASSASLRLPGEVDEFVAGLPVAFNATVLCNFATPAIGGSRTGRFDAERFAAFLGGYVTGVAALVEALVKSGRTPAAVLNPSSAFVDAPPRQMGEYVCAKAAAEALGRHLVSVHPDMTVMSPRWPAMATDQTVSTVPRRLADAESIVLRTLRGLVAAPAGFSTTGYELEPGESAK